jgi:large subunit ribosomal protein L22
MVSQATLRYLKTSAQKARLVVDQIRGADVGDALAVLQASDKRAARAVMKLLNSAIANATQREERVDVDRLYVSRAWVDQGPSDKRGRAGTMGRFFPVLHRRSHITLQLDVRDPRSSRRHRRRG